MNDPNAKVPKWLQKHLQILLETGRDTSLSSSLSGSLGEKYQIAQVLAKIKVLIAYNQALIQRKANTQ
jgi:hypothetical protein